MKLLLVVLMLVLVMGAAVAEEEKLFTEVDKFDLHSGGGGPTVADIGSDGILRVTFFWLNDDGSVNRQEPKGELGDLYYTVRNDFPPRHFKWDSPGPDAMTIVSETSTWALVTWK